MKNLILDSVENLRGVESHYRGMEDEKVVYWWIRLGGLVHAIRDCYVSARDDVYLFQTVQRMKKARKEPWEHVGH
jgi:hypothetical protein